MSFVFSSKTHIMDAGWCRILEHCPGILFFFLSVLSPCPQETPTEWNSSPQWNSRMAQWFPENVTRATTDSKLSNYFVGRVKMFLPIQKDHLRVTNESDLNQKKVWWMWRKVPFDVNQSSTAGSLCAFSHKHTHTRRLEVRFAAWHSRLQTVQFRWASVCQRTERRSSVPKPNPWRKRRKNFTFNATEWNVQEENYYSELPLLLPSLRKTSQWPACLDVSRLEE